MFVTSIDLQKFIQNCKIEIVSNSWIGATLKSIWLFLLCLMSFNVIYPCIFCYQFPIYFNTHHWSFTAVMERKMEFLHLHSPKSRCDQWMSFQFTSSAIARLALRIKRTQYKYHKPHRTPQTQCNQQHTLLMIMNRVLFGDSYSCIEGQRY